MKYVIKYDWNSDETHKYKAAAYTEKGYYSLAVSSISFEDAKEKLVASLKADAERDNNATPPPEEVEI